MNLDAIKRMTQQEKLQAMDALWDALVHAEREPASPQWHGEILAARREKLEAGSATFVALDELKVDADE